ncbi:hypothetical protein BDU57DRAFT_91194 [Ampelomyces quisqualis]|uniref:Uncharacterized protein n=1 Tax=Ampelomyces quisqualis TaxID=50730 RepID=A0A6A5QAV3_AMPQU|nr:hypothetical protein BDU57DRAFT_91194 [Ampelomyces quisqualis]
MTRRTQQCTSPCGSLCSGKMPGYILLLHPAGTAIWANTLAKLPLQTGGWNLLLVVSPNSRESNPSGLCNRCSIETTRKTHGRCTNERLTPSTPQSSKQVLTHPSTNIISSCITNVRKIMLGIEMAGHICQDVAASRPVTSRHPPPLLPCSRRATRPHFGRCRGMYSVHEKGPSLITLCEAFAPNLRWNAHTEPMPCFALWVAESVSCIVCVCRHVERILGQIHGRRFYCPGTSCMTRPPHLSNTRRCIDE